MHDIHDLLAPIQTLHALIRDRVLLACETAALESLSEIAHEAEGDTIYAVDRVSEELLIEFCEREIAPFAPIIATISPGCTVDVLGRYQFERQLMPHRASAGITLTFRTVHASKGLEADHVILPNLTTGTFGFPSQIADDPVLNLAMPDGDGFPHSEERRLFYVALTRARQSVTIFTVAGLESPFVVELLTDPDVVVQDSEGATTPTRSCPGCGLGTLVLRSGRYGEFYGCSTFPKCSHTVRLERAPSQS